MFGTTGVSAQLVVGTEGVYWIIIIIITLAVEELNDCRP